MVTRGSGLTIALNLGGEGERVVGVDLVVNANLFEPLLMVRPDFVARLASGQVAVRMSAGRLGLRDSCVDLIVGHHFPVQFDRTADRFGIDDVARESFRVARPGADLRFGCSSCDVDALAEAFAGAGFVSVELDAELYAVRARKP